MDFCFDVFLVGGLADFCEVEDELDTFRFDEDFMEEDDDANFDANFASVAAFSCEYSRFAKHSVRNDHALVNERSEIKEEEKCRISGDEDDGGGDDDDAAAACADTEK